MRAQPLGPKTRRECEQWADTFALELPLVENAVQGYVAVLEGTSASPATDEEIAKTLAQLRHDLSKMMTAGKDVREHTKNLEEIAARLDRSIVHTEVLEQAGVTASVPELRPRLLAARALVTAVRAALARRPKPRSGSNGFD